MKILGIDPGLINTGYGVIEIKNKKISVIDYGIIQPSRKQPLSKRLRIIYDDTKLIIKKYNPKVCVVEEVFYSNNFKTSLLLGQARAAVLIASAKMSLKIADYSARKIKQSITGNGNSNKEQVQFMVKNILFMDNIPEPIDASDALAVAICHYHNSN